jgi:hypothetical protein
MKRLHLIGEVLATLTVSYWMGLVAFIGAGFWYPRDVTNWSVGIGGFIVAACSIAYLQHRQALAWWGHRHRLKAILEAPMTPAPTVTLWNKLSRKIPVIVISFLLAEIGMGFCLGLAEFFDRPGSSTGIMKGFATICVFIVIGTIAERIIVWKAEGVNRR